MRKEYQPKTGARCHCKRGVQRDNCPNCEGTGMVIDFKAIRARTTTPPQAMTWYARTTNTGSPFEQGIIADENTGASIAVSYDSKHAPLIAAAPELLAALNVVKTDIADFYEQNEDMKDAFCGTLATVNAAISKATT